MPQFARKVDRVTVMVTIKFKGGNTRYKRHLTPGSFDSTYNPLTVRSFDCLFCSLLRPTVRGTTLLC